MRLQFALGRQGASVQPTMTASYWMTEVWGGASIRMERGGGGRLGEGERGREPWDGGRGALQAARQATQEETAGMSRHAVRGKVMERERRRERET